MKHINLFEPLLYVAILLVVLSMPFFTGVFEYMGWSETMKNSVRILPFVLIFLLNNYIFVPRLLFAEKYLYYFLLCILTVFAVVYLSNFLFNLTHLMQPPLDRMPPSDFPFPQGKMPPPDMPFPQGKIPPPDSFPFSRNNMPFKPGRSFPPVNNQLFFIFGQALISFLLIGFNVGVKGFVRWINERERFSERERQYLHTELAFLKHQISPHFFMNTLNNIHSLVDIDAEKARNSIVKLSRLMRYMLYEAEVQKVSLKKEIDFIESYIELMRIRYDEDILEIGTKYPDNMENIYVPSFLFLSFIENAFKHGINLNIRSLILISFSIEYEQLKFNVINNRWDKTTSQTETTGIGLENVRKRLDLIYEDKYTLDIQSSDTFYIVTLKLPLS